MNRSLTSNLSWISAKFITPFLMLLFSGVFFAEVSTWPESNILLPVVVFGLFFGFVLLPTFLFSFVRMDDEGIEISSLFGSGRKIPYGKIEAIHGPYFINYSPLIIKIKDEPSFLDRHIFTPVSFFDVSGVTELKSRV